ncbi:hypothetical protein [Thermococcus sp. JCM 11816]|uniref:hypothetical protein n=1 Tax=Thermococcus sp. (strain JCM 11816 / KS-1) TaxID=1295125 RepID=UPI0006D2AD23
MLTVNPATQDLGIGLIFQPLEKSQVEEYREALVGGKALIFYYSPDCTGNSEDIEIKSIVLKGKNADLGGAQSRKSTLIWQRRVE